MIKFVVSAETPTSPTELIDNIFDITNWYTFEGWGPIPKIESAEMSNYTDAKVGTVFSLKNADGSSHQETVTAYTPAQSLIMRMDNFSAPLNKLADHFVESWHFERRNNQTYLERSLELHPKNLIGSIMLRPISYFLKRAIQAHTEQIVAA